MITPNSVIDYSYYKFALYKTAKKYNGILLAP